MKSLFYAGFILLFSIPTFAQKEIISFKIDSVKKQIGQGEWKNYNEKWSNGTIVIDNIDKYVVKIFNSDKSEFDGYFWIPALSTDFTDYEKNKVYVFWGLNTSDEKCSIYLYIPPKNDNSKQISIVILEPKVSFTFYLKLIK